MERFVIEPIVSSTLPDLASFLRRWRDNQIEDSTVPHVFCEDLRSIERRLRWLLVQNPVPSERSEHGFCIHDHLGIIRGVNLSFPAAFVAGDQRLLGLCSGSFFVEPQARTLGYHLFRKYLRSRGYSFFFATTCNAKSGALWRKLGGYAVPNSDKEHILPLRLDSMLRAVVAERTSSQIASRIGGLLGRSANPILQLLTRHSAGLALEPCQDWQKLSELFHRHRRRDWIASDRSAAFLQWRYGPTSPHYPCDIYLFRDNLGNEGWFSLGNLMRGPLRGSVLLDAVWPREKISFRNIFSEILRVVADGADAIFFRPQPEIDYREYSRWIISRRLEAPRVFVINQKGEQPLAVASLDYDGSDYGTWSVRWGRA